MMNETNIKRIDELMANEEFAQKFFETGSYEKAYELFVENGVDASYDDFIAYIEDCRKIMAEKGLITEDGELGEELLEAVSGGKWYHSVFCFAVAAAAFYVGMPHAGGLMIVAGIAMWKA